ncbi:MAG: hypothetical protein DWQ37_02875 [Planctomycetota bacterium]|nr:MAG: hypothetical protein DWQ37_02875 [Planctomycetota bacterium]
MSAEAVRETIARWQRGGLLVAAVGVGLCALAATVRLDTLLESYLLGFLFWWMVSIGCLGVLLVYYLSGGRWGLAARPFLECGAMTMPLAALAFVPIALQMDRIYPWAAESEHTVASADASPAEMTSDAGHHIPPDVQRLYLNVEFAQARAVGYFVLWVLLVLAFCLRARRGPRRPRGRRRLAAVALALMILTCTFASIDWGMSLDPGWFSTIYGALIAMGGALAGLAITTAAAASLQSRTPSGTQLVVPPTLADLGTLTMAFLMLWAYFAFSQFLIIYAGNLPEENVWYITRLQGGWQWFGLAAIVGGFVVPFGLLLSRDLKHNPRWLAGVALLVFGMQFVYLAWTILPSFRPGEILVRWTDVVAPLALGGLWTALFASLLARRVPEPQPTTEDS